MDQMDRCRRPSPPLPPLPTQPAVSAPPRRSRLAPGSWCPCPPGLLAGSEVPQPGSNEVGSHCRCRCRRLPRDNMPHSSLIPRLGARGGASERSGGARGGRRGQQRHLQVGLDHHGRVHVLPPLPAATCEWRFHMDGFAYPFWFSPLRLLFLPPSAVGTSYGELHCYGGIDFPKQGAVRQGHVGMLQLATCKKLASASRCWSRRWGVAALVHWSNARSATACRSSACVLLSCATARPSTGFLTVTRDK